MPKNLLIVESPAKAKTITKYLGDKFIVASSYGHIRDLPKNNKAIDIENGFLPSYEVSKEKEKVVKMNKITIDKIPELVAKRKKTFDSIREYSKMNAKNYLNGTVAKATKIIVDVYSRTNLELAFTSLVEYLSYYESKQYAEYYMLLHSDKSTEREKLMTEIIYCTIENGLLVHIHSEDTKSIVDIVCDLKESRWALNSDELEVMTIKNTFISGKDKIN